MEIVKLPVGERAAENVDCIHIERIADGRYDLTGSALVSCDDGSDDAESVALISGATYGSDAEAETAGIAWAKSSCVERLYVSRSG